MDIRYASLNKRIVLQDYTERFDELGCFIRDWFDYTEVWAKVDFIEKNWKPGVGAEQSFVFTVRYLPEIKTSMRVKYNNKIFEIETLCNHQSRNRYLLIQANERT